MMAMICACSVSLHQLLLAFDALHIFNADLDPFVLNKSMT